MTAYRLSNVFDNVGRNPEFSVPEHPRDVTNAVFEVGPAATRPSFKSLSPTSR